MNSPEAITTIVEKEETTQEIDTERLKETTSVAEDSATELPYILGKNSEKIYILSEEILSKHGCFVTAKRYLKGRHPELGTLAHPEDTWSGDWETIQIVTYIVPLETFLINSRDSSLN